MSHTKFEYNLITIAYLNKVDANFSVKSSWLIQTGNSLRFTQNISWKHKCYCSININKT